MSLYQYHKKAIFACNGPSIDDNMQMLEDLLNLLSSLPSAGDSLQVSHPRNVGKAILPAPDN